MAALFAYLHTMSMVALGAMLFAQMLTIDSLHDHKAFRSFRNYSVVIVVAFVVALVSGIALLLLTDRGSAFYLHNPVFYIKLAVFVAMLLVAITPARIIYQWHRDAKAGLEYGGALEDVSLVPIVQRYIMLEIILLLVVPLAASLAGRGIGTQLSAS